MKLFPLIPFLAATAFHAASAADVSVYALTKTQGFRQTSVATPTPLATGGFTFGSVVNRTTAASVTSATLLLPGAASPTPLGPVSGFGALAIVQTFNTKAALDAAYTAGSYAFTINAVNDGTKTPSLSFGADDYPNTPTITNFVTAQNIDWTQPFTLQWGTFIGGAAGVLGDSIQLIILRKNGTTLFSTPLFGSTGALDGTKTSVEIPANTFVPGEPYTATLIFGNIVSINFLAYVGVPGVVAFAKTTEFPMKAPGTSPALLIAGAPVAGSYELTWNADIGRTYDLVRTLDLSPPVVTWTRVALVTGTASTMTRTDTPPGSPASGFYRLQDPP